jgi:hypothetical protein
MRHPGPPLLAGIRIFDELKERSFGLESQKLSQESAFCGNFHQAPAKQTIELKAATRVRKCHDGVIRFTIAWKRG